MTNHTKAYEQLYREWEEREEKRKLEQDADEFIAKHRD